MRCAVAELSPAAKLVLHAVHEVMAEQQFALSGVPDYRPVAAAALRAIPIETNDRAAIACIPERDRRWYELGAANYRRRVLAIATELESAQ